MAIRLPKLKRRPLAHKARGRLSRPLRAVSTYFRDSWQELAKVSWPNRQTTISLTVAVLVFSTTLALFMGLADLGLNIVLKKLILK